MFAGYFTPWDATQRTSADRIERHLAHCRIMSLDYSTHPREINPTPEALAAADHAVQQLERMLAWAPKDTNRSAPDPFKLLLDGAPIEHAAVAGGRGSGKSFEAADTVIELASTRTERVCAAREHMVRIKQSSMELLVSRIAESQWKDDWSATEYELRNSKTDSVIFFIGLSGQSADSVAKSLEGVSLLWVDECQLLAQNSINVIMPSIRAIGSRCLWCWNPGESPSPVDKLFRGPEPPERSAFKISLIETNAHLYRSRLSSEMRSSFRRDDEATFRHIWRGAHLEITSATIFRNVYEGYLNWDTLTCGGADAEECFGMDFSNGGASPNAVVKVYMIPSKSIPEPQAKPIIYIAAEKIERDTLVQNLHALAVSVGGTHREIICDSALPRFIDEMNQSGTVSAKAVVKELVISGLRRLQSCDILISPDCPLSLTEFRGLKWAVDPKTNEFKEPPVPVGSDHCIDCVRYATSRTDLTSSKNGGVVYV